MAESRRALSLGLKREPRKRPGCKDREKGKGGEGDGWEVNDLEPLLRFEKGETESG